MGEEADRIVGLELGADDYIAKPPAMREMIARIRAVHRRVSDMERVSRNLSAVPAMQGVAELLSAATAA